MFLRTEKTWFSTLESQSIFFFHRSPSSSNFCVCLLQTPVMGVWVLLVPKKTNLALFCLCGFWFINFDSQESEFSMIFNMFVNMLWIAEGFGYMRLPFKVWSVNNFCTKKQKTDFLLLSPFSLGYYWTNS